MTEVIMVWLMVATVGLDNDVKQREPMPQGGCEIRAQHLNLYTNRIYWCEQEKT